MVFLAYDGSLNGDWVARYAIRFAAHDAERMLTLVHIQDESLDAAGLERKLEHLRRECLAQGVELFPQLLPLTRSVVHSLLPAVPSGGDNLLVCGTRVRSARKPFLAGTVTEQLLRHAPFPVLAVRVVQPGLLGVPRNLLLPLAGHPRGFAAAWPFFRRFLPDVETVHLLRGMVVSSFRLRQLSREQLHALRERGVRYLAAVTEEILHRRGDSAFRLDSRIVVCDDWPHEILVHASRLQTRILLLGASERSKLYRLLHRDTLEQVLRGTPCDVGIYRWP